MAGLFLKTGEILIAKQPAPLRFIVVCSDRAEKQFQLLEKSLPNSIGLKTGIAPFSAHSPGNRAHAKHDARLHIKVQLSSLDDIRLIKVRAHS